MHKYLFLKINQTRERPDEIRPESDLTRLHLFSNPTGPERKQHLRVHSLQPWIGPEKWQGPADWFGRCSITLIQFIYLFISTLFYIFPWWILVILFGF